MPRLAFPKLAFPFKKKPDEWNPHIVRYVRSTIPTKFVYDIIAGEKYVKNRDLTESSSKEYQQGYGVGKAGHDEPCPYKDDVQRSDWLNGYEDGFKYAKWDDKDKPNWNKPKKMSVSSLNANFDLP